MFLSFHSRHTSLSIYFFSTEVLVKIWDRSPNFWHICDLKISLLKSYWAFAFTLLLGLCSAPCILCFFKTRRTLKALRQILALKRKCLRPTKNVRALLRNVGGLWENVGALLRKTIDFFFEVNVKESIFLFIPKTSYLFKTMEGMWLWNQKLS